VERVVEESAAQALIAKGFKPVDKKNKSGAKKADKQKDKDLKAEGGESDDGDRKTEEADGGNG
jgi:hypothetical protein